MTNEVNGIVRELFEPQTGTGIKGDWKKKSFLIETEDKYPKKIYLDAWNGAADFAEKLNIGDKINALIDIEAKLHNNNWYTKIKACKISVTEKAGKAPSVTETEEDLPF